MTDTDRRARPASASRERFARALASVSAADRAEAAIDALFQELVERHGEPHRHYHNLDHVDACLSWLDWFHALATRPAEVELALWFHDLVYEPARTDNEQRSAELARQRLALLGVPGEVADRIAGHVLATRDHNCDAGDRALVVDLDLTILGAAPAVFDEFECAIRREYAHVPEKVYREARRQILGSFLARPLLYHHPPLRQQLEHKARANLERRVGQLA